MAAPSFDRDSRDALAVYGYLLLSARQTQKAHDLFKGMLALFPDDGHVVKSLAFTSLALGDAAGALALADRAAGLVRPDEALALDVIRGRAFAALGQMDRAREALGRALASRSVPAPGRTGATGNKANGMTR